jgi:YfiH family protein
MSRQSRRAGERRANKRDVDRKDAPSLEYELPGGGRVVFTDRAAGNVSSVSGDGAEEGARARERLRAALGVRALARGYQVHGSRVRWVEEVAGRDAPLRRPDDDADGQATALAGVGAMVLTADCLPVALGADGAVAMLHAGWRGLAAGVLEEGVRTLRERAAGEIAAVLGPAAGACCYEVGPEVHAALGTGEAGRANIDLRAVARARLETAGVSAIEETQLCTICDERFFSHRREGARAGRQGGVAWLS